MRPPAIQNFSEISCGAKKNRPKIARTSQPPNLYVSREFAGGATLINIILGLPVKSLYPKAIKVAACEAGISAKFQLHSKNGPKKPLNNGSKWVNPIVYGLKGLPP